MRWRNPGQPSRKENTVGGLLAKCARKKEYVFRRQGNSDYSETRVAVTRQTAELRSAWTGEGARPHTSGLQQR